VNTAITAEQIDALLPQTQCRQCGFDGCLPYAQAMARGEADINRCPPGGDEAIVTLAHLLRRAVLPLDVSRGAHKPRHVAVIDEQNCIGCTRCIQACPVDAIIGTFKAMHTVIADECTGCDLCLAPCPVDCILMVPAPAESRDQKTLRANQARERYRARNERLLRDERERNARHEAKLAAALRDAETEKKRATIRAAVERVRAKRAQT
jgi:electron transport complex protein RnfB